MPDKTQTKGNPAETNKDLVRRFYQEVFLKGDIAAAKNYLSKDYRQHNPMVPTGQQGFIDFFTSFAKQAPGMKLDVKRMIADPEFVVVHSLMTMGPSDRGAAVVDIFRMKDGKIVEHWDVTQPIPEQMAHSNTMF